MKLKPLLGVIGFVVLAGASAAQDNLQRGIIKKADAAKSILTITVDGKDQDLLVTAETRVIDASINQPVMNPFEKAFAAGTPVVFKAERRDGQSILVGVRIGGGQPVEGGGIRRGIIQKIDLDKKLITLKASGKDHDLLLTEETHVLGAAGKDLKERLKGFNAGTEVFFKLGQQNGKTWLAGIKRVEGAGSPAVRPTFDSSKLVPLNELGAKEYQGFKGGFYPDGKNERPPAHEAAGLRLAKQVQPLDPEGKPHPQGKIVLLSIGMSNTSQASMGFQKILDADQQKHPQLVFVNGAQGGMTATRIQNPDNPDGAKFWSTVDQRLKQAGVTRDQVQTVWIKQADAGPSEGFPGYAKKLQEELANIVQILPKRFPNAKLVYLSSRTYGGFAKTLLNPEPYAYESAFAVKWLIEQQIQGAPALNFDAGKGAIKAPWLSWGPYLWANGTTKRGDGFHYEERDFAGDGTHHAQAGVEKLGNLMMQFFKTDTTARAWFLREGAEEKPARPR